MFVQLFEIVVSNIVVWGFFSRGFLFRDSIICVHRWLSFSSFRQDYIQLYVVHNIILLY